MNQQNKEEAMKRRTKRRAIKNAITATIVLLIATIFSVSCAPTTPPTITILDGVPGDHTQIEHEIREGIEFFCQERHVSKCNQWTYGLEIEVRNEPEAYGNQFIYGEMYLQSDYFWIVWFDGIHHNAFFHEMMHRDFGPRSASHDKEFMDETRRIRNAWKVDQGIRE